MKLHQLKKILKKKKNVLVFNKKRNLIFSLFLKLLNLNNDLVRYSLCNHITFPPVTIMSNCDETSDIYYDIKTGLPKVHWALVVEINHLLKHPTKIGNILNYSPLNSFTSFYDSFL